MFSWQNREEKWEVESVSGGGLSAEENVIQSHYSIPIECDMKGEKFSLYEGWRRRDLSNIERFSLFEVGVEMLVDIDFAFSFVSSAANAFQLTEQEIVERFVVDDNTSSSIFGLSAGLSLSHFNN